LLDTHVLLWWFEQPDNLARTAYAAVELGENETYVSPVSLYEISFKAATGKLQLDVDLAAEAEQVGFAPLPLTWEHARVAGSLPLHHRDPFDRMLVAQARAERLTLVTRDERLGRYGVPLLVA
jgi:PIN domain nuclease of toxin-antitoxin system